MAAAAWFGWGAYTEQNAQELFLAADEALLAGDFPRATALTAELVQTEADHPRLAELRGRIALASQDLDTAARELAGAWRAILVEPEGPAVTARVGRAAATALLRSGEFAAAFDVADRALADLHGLVDTHLDREDLGSDATPQKGFGTDAVARATASGLELVALFGEIAAKQAENLRRNGDAEAADHVLERATDRIAATTCTGTHRIICRGVRAAFRDKSLAPMVALRTRIRIERAVAMVNNGHFEQALSLAHSAAQDVSDLAADQPDNADKQRASKRTAEVEYAVRVAWARSLEKAREWGGAREQYDAAAALWNLHGGFEAQRIPPAGPQLAAAASSTDEPIDGPTEDPEPPAPVAPHTQGLARAKAVADALDETSHVLDRLSALGLGDTNRKALHDRIAADPTNPQIYAELALQDARAARDGRLDAETAKVLVQRSETWITTSRRVAPEQDMPRFYDGVLRFIRGDTGRGIQKMRRAYRRGYRDDVADLYLGEALSVVGKHRLAARHWTRAYKNDKANAFALMRAVESLLAAGRSKSARALLAEATAKEAAFSGGPLSATHHGAQAIAMMHLHDNRLDDARKVLTVARALRRPEIADVQRASSIAAAAYNRIATTSLAKILQPGEELLDTYYGYTVAAGAATTAQSLHCALLIFTTKRLVVARWDASHDYREEVRKGVALAGKAARLGQRLAGDWVRYNLGIGSVYTLLDQLAGRPVGARPTSRLSATTALVIDSLDLYDRIRADIERNVDPQKVRIFEVSGPSMVAWALVSADAAKGLWTLTARQRDGRSPWQTDGDTLEVVTDSPALLRALLRRQFPGASRLSDDPKTATDSNKEP